MNLGRAFKVLRTFHNFQQNDLSERLGFSSSYLSELENEKKLPTLPVLEAYAQTFEIKIWSIFYLAEWLNNSDQEPSLCPKIQQMINLLKMF
jgi:transcriptional regulator with XRE-family HTH domain